MSAMLPKMPPPVEINEDGRKAVIGGVKRVLETFQAHDLFDKSASYQDLIGNAENLYNFIQAFRGHRDLVDEIVHSKEGGPVRDDTTPLICDVTLEQIQRLLVVTCARRFYKERAGPDKVVMQQKTTRHFLFFKKVEQVKKVVKSDDSRKHAYLLEYLAFDWQLPLLEAYEALGNHHFIELGPAVLALQTPEAIAEVASLDGPQVRRVRETMKTELAEVLMTRPHAIHGVLAWPADFYVFLKKLLGEKMWEFFSRDRAFFTAAAFLDKPRMKAFGEGLTYISAEAVMEMQRLDLDRTELVLLGLNNALGEEAHAILAHPAFAKDVLRKMVDSLSHMKGEREKLAMSIDLTCKAMAHDIRVWYEKAKTCAPAHPAQPSPAAGTAAMPAAKSA